MHFINPVPFSAEYSMNAILAIVMGGSGTVAGPVIGSFILTFLPEYLRLAESFRLIIYAVLLVVITIFMPRGIVHVFTVAAEKLRKH
jgi:branched-chain amino acid transport system permease protein